MVRVLIVEDSPTVRENLIYILSSDSDIQVVGTAGDGEEAIGAVELYHPDVITMDLHMPGMDGFEATRRIMEAQPTPIVVISGNRDVHEVEVAFQAMQAGALTLLERPRGIGHPSFDESAQACIRAVKAMSEVKVIRRWPRQSTGISNSDKPAGIPRLSLPRGVSKIRMVAIGASTGGPQAVQTILAGLTKPFPTPVLLVQHMAAGFVQGLAEWLGNTCGLSIHVARQDQDLMPGHVYIAPDGNQMGITRENRIALVPKAPGELFAPSVDFLFRSVTALMGAEAIGILLTGMGRDGAVELAQMRRTGAITIAQDAETAVINGMPGEAVKLDAARYVLPPTAIASTLSQLMRGR